MYRETTERLSRILTSIGISVAAPEKTDATGCSREKRRVAGDPHVRTAFSAYGNACLSNTIETKSRSQRPAGSTTHVLRRCVAWDYFCDRQPPAMGLIIEAGIARNASEGFRELCQVTASSYTSLPFSHRYYYYSDVVGLSGVFSSVVLADKR